MDHYEVWDVVSGTMLGLYPTEAEALELVRGLVETNDAGYADDLAVGHERPDGSFEGPWSGAELLARIEAMLAAHR